MADYRRQFDEGSREPRSWFADDDPRRRSHEDERYLYGGERNARYESSRSSGYDGDRASRWEGGADDRYGYAGGTGMYRTDDRSYHDRYRDYERERERDDRDRDRYSRESAANDYYRAARDQRDDYLRWSAHNMGTWGDQSHVQHDEPAPAWHPRERGGYWRQYEAGRGQFAGRGPRDYQRSDERIREEICDCMTDDGRLDASDISVAVSHGEVTLTGSVMSREQKRRAEDVAERISGVRDVTNQLRVSRDADGHDWSRDSSRVSAQGTTSSQPVSEASGKGTPGKSTSSSTA